MKKFFGYLFAIVVVLLILGSFVVLYKKSKAKAVTYQTESPEITDIVKKTVATGSIVPRQSVEVKPTSGLSQDEISGLINESERFKETDKLRRELAELNNQAQTLIYTSEQALEGYADLISEEAADGVRQHVEVLRQTLESGVDLASMRHAYAQLEAATFAIAESMYGTSETTQG